MLTYVFVFNIDDFANVSGCSWGIPPAFAIETQLLIRHLFHDGMSDSLQVLFPGGALCRDEVVGHEGVSSGLKKSGLTSFLSLFLIVSCLTLMVKSTQ